MPPFDDTPIRSFCVEFNCDDLVLPASPGLFSHADPSVHLDWYLERGVNVIQTFCVAYNGYAWYRGSEVAPVNPGLKHDFLPELTELGHRAGVRVMGYFNIGSNPVWHLAHINQYPGVQQNLYLPLSSEYIDYQCRSIQDALRKNDIDGFMLDWFKERPREGTWLPIEQQMFKDLMGEPFPESGNPSEEAAIEFDRRSVDRAWGRVRDAIREVSSDTVIWTNHPFPKPNDPRWNGSRLLREVDWVLNEGPDVAINEWLASQIGPSTKIIQCMSGWDEHNVFEIAAKLDPTKIGLYGFAHPDAVTTLPSMASKPKDYENAEKTGELYRKLQAAVTS